MEGNTHTSENWNKFREDVRNTPPQGTPALNSIEAYISDCTKRLMFSTGRDEEECRQKAIEMQGKWLPHFLAAKNPTATHIGLFTHDHGDTPMQTGYARKADWPGRPAWD